MPGTQAAPRRRSAANSFTIAVNLGTPNVVAKSRTKERPCKSAGGVPRHDPVDQFLELVARLIARRHLQQSCDLSSQNRPQEPARPAKPKSQLKKEASGRKPPRKR
jgi:hypothetical protein